MLFAVHRRGHRTNGALMLHQCPYSGIVRFNGLFGGSASERPRGAFSLPGRARRQDLRSEFFSAEPRRAPNLVFQSLSSVGEKLIVAGSARRFFRKAAARTVGDHGPLLSVDEVDDLCINEAEMSKVREAVLGRVARKRSQVPAGPDIEDQVGRWVCGRDLHRSVVVSDSEGLWCDFQTAETLEVVA